MLCNEGQSLQGQGLKKGHGRIRALPDTVAQKVKSSATITSLIQVILGLLENSLDAGARKVEIQVQQSRGSCSVEDDGHGILPLEFATDGGLGQMHHSSKYDGSGGSFGRNGNFLASLSALSLMTVVSKHQAFRSTNRLTIHRSEVLSRLTPAPVSESFRFREHGTMVSVRDLFGNMPVRVKHRSLTNQTSSSLERLWDTLGIRVVAYLLAWKTPVFIKLIDLDSGKIIVDVGVDSHRTDSTSSASVKRCHDSSLPRLYNILDQGNYADLLDTQSWIPASASSSSFRIKGVIGLMPSPTRSLQFISIGCRPLFSDDDTHGLFNLVNRVFKKSDFGSLSVDGNGSQMKASSARDRVTTQKELKLGRKGVNRWPTFDFNISFKAPSMQTLHYRDLAETEIPEKIVEALEALVINWLLAHHFKVSSRGHTNIYKQSNSFSKSPEASSGTGKNLEKALASTAGASSTKIADSGLSVAGTVRLIDMVENRHQTRNINQILDSKYDSTRMNQKEVSMDSVLTQFPGNDIEMSSTSHSAEKLDSNMNTTPIQVVYEVNEHVQPDQVKTWIDPITHTAHTINARTGMPLRGQAAKVKCQPSGRLTMRSSISHSSKPDAGWIFDLRTSWTNPIFQEAAEEAIPQADGRSCQNLAKQHHKSSRCRHHAHDTRHLPGDLSILPNNIRFSKDSLRRARVIQQVNRQFILVAMPIEGSQQDDTELLAAIDQHAADERIRVEMLYAELCALAEEPTIDSQESSNLAPKVAHTNIYPPITFQVFDTEYNLFLRHSNQFRRWGISYGISKNSKDISHGHLSIETLPRVIVERCRAEPELLISMLRSHIWSIAERSVADDNIGNPAAATTSPQWLQAIGGCPEGILDMLNTRACRSAIMFNDYLDLEECTQLVQRLSSCSFPFQCAHGRPSMTPLLRVGINSLRDETSSSKTIKQRGSLSFASAAQAWRLGEL